MRSWMIAFSLGIFTCGFIPQLPSPPLQFLALVLPLLSLRFTHLRLAGAFSFGLFWFLSWALAGQEKLLSPELEGQDIWVRGEVVSLPQQAERSQRFEFLINASQQKILLNLYADLAIKPGQQWQLKVRLKRPHGFANPGGFDYEAWLLQNQISATGYIRSDPENRLLKQNITVFSFQQLRYNFREKLDALNQQYSFNNLALIKALTIGDRYNITDDEWDIFSATGTNHLMVISGLHVGLVTWLIYRLSIFLFSFTGTLLLYIPAQRFAAFTAIFAAFFYAGLAGFSLPSQRAFIMVAVFMSGQCLKRNTCVLNTYCLALGLVLGFDPMAPQSVGFWLSFGAVGVLVLLGIQHQKNSQDESNLLAEPPSFYQKCWVLIKMQSLLFIGLMPLMLLFFQQLSLLAPLVNIVAIPFVSFLVVPLCLSGLVSIAWFPGLALLLFKGADFLLTIFKQSLNFLIQYFAFSVIQLPALSWFSWLVLLSGLSGLLFLPYSTKVYKLIKALSLSCFAPLLFTRQDSLPLTEFSLEVLDVGQGLALLISTKTHKLIYDAGPVYSPRFNAGSGLLIPYIRTHNIDNIDTIIISHGDNDHSGGLSALVATYPETEYLTSDMGLVTGPNVSLCQVGDAWVWDEVSFEILHPEGSSYAGNNSSCVLKVSSGAYAVLLSGDIEKRAERELLRRGSPKLKANVLIAPHHGSLTSSTRAFIDAVAPEYVVFSSGYLNRFNHPHPDVSMRYEDRAIKILNTSKLGAIRFHISANGGVAVPLSYRNTRRRYWSLPQE